MVKEGEEDRPKFKSVGISRRSLNIVRAGMNKVTNETGGTAYRARIVDKVWKWRERLAPSKFEGSARRSVKRVIMNWRGKSGTTHYL